MEQEFIVRFWGPSPDDPMRQALIAKRAYIAGELPGWQNRNYANLQRQILVTAESEEAALEIIQSVLGPGRPGDHWDRFDVRLYQDETDEIEERRRSSKTKTGSEMDEITVQGQDGTTFHYHAIERADVEPPFVSWILIIEGGNRAPVEPQRVSAAEVLGDLVSMQVDPDDARERVAASTTRMLSFAREAASNSDDPEWSDVVARLADELAALSAGGLGSSEVEAPGPSVDIRESTWFYKKLSDYWDQNVQAVEAGAQRLAKLEGDDRTNATTEISSAVAEHVRVLPQDLLASASVSFADDLYKAASSIGYWDDSVADYLEAAAGTISRLLSERGLRIQYLVDNLWGDMSRPFGLFPGWYQAAGFAFACPQVMVRSLAEGGDVDFESDPAGLTARYIVEARHVIEMLTVKCAGQGQHVMHLDTDYQKDTFESALQRQGDPGVVTVFRSEAPEPGSKVDVWLPQE